MNASDVLKYGNLTLLGTLEGLTRDQWVETGACGVWSTKDILAHLVSYEFLLAEAVAPFTGGGSTPTMEAFAKYGPDGFNDYEVDRRKAMNVTEVLDEYSAIHERTTTLVARILPETLRQVGTILWYGPEYALDDFIVYAIYGHKREHCGQIAIFRDRFK